MISSVSNAAFRDYWFICVTLLRNLSVVHPQYAADLVIAQGRKGPAGKNASPPPNIRDLSTTDHSQPDPSCRWPMRLTCPSTWVPCLRRSGSRSPPLTLVLKIADWFSRTSSFWALERHPEWGGGGYMWHRTGHGHSPLLLRGGAGARIEPHLMMQVKQYAAGGPGSSEGLKVRSSNLHPRHKTLPQRPSLPPRSS